MKKKEFFETFKQLSFMIVIIIIPISFFIYNIYKNTKKNLPSNDDFIAILKNEDQTIMIDKITWQILANFFAKAGDTWAERERADGDFEWKDVVAEFWLELRDKNPFLKDDKIIEEEVNQRVQLILHDIKEGKKNENK